jgi:hypothetical protein
LLFNIATEYTLKKAQKNNVGLKLNGTHQPLVNVDDVNLPGRNIDTTKKNTGTVVDASKDASLEVKAEKTNYILLSRHQDAEQNPDIIIGDTSFENVSQLRYLGMTEINHNFIQAEIKRKFYTSKIIKK